MFPYLLPLGRSAPSQTACPSTGLGPTQGRDPPTSDSRDRDGYEGRGVQRVPGWSSSPSIGGPVHYGRSPVHSQYFSFLVSEGRSSESRGSVRGWRGEEVRGGRLFARTDRQDVSHLTPTPRLRRDPGPDDRVSGLTDRMSYPQGRRGKGGAGREDPRGERRTGSG